MQFKTLFCEFFVNYALLDDHLYVLIIRSGFLLRL